MGDSEDALGGGGEKDVEKMATPAEDESVKLWDTGAAAACGPFESFAPDHGFGQPSYPPCGEKAPHEGQAPP